MSGAEAIAAVSVIREPDAAAAARLAEVQAPPPAVKFQDILTAGFSDLETRLNSADAMVRKFAIDDTVPIHQVTAAIEEARLAIELAVQVRARVVETYRDIMNMQI